MTAWLDEFRIVKGTAVWTSGFTPEVQTAVPLTILNSSSHAVIRAIRPRWRRYAGANECSPSIGESAAIADHGYLVGLVGIGCTSGITSANKEWKTANCSADCARNTAGTADANSTDQDIPWSAMAALSPILRRAISIRACVPYATSVGLP